jgi:histidyl-tRNA synthetase
VEETEVFSKGVGLSTDIVEKEMYSFKTKGGDSLTLRPEGTAGVVRAYIENNMSTWPQPVKLYYSGPMFRHESPQKDRYRQLFQFGLEALGDPSPVMDVEIIWVSHLIFNALGFKDINFELNSIGCPNCRADYLKVIKAFYKTKTNKLCPTCKERFKTNPLRLLDCKEEKCSELRSSLPSILDSLCSECHDHFHSVLDILDYLQVPYILNPYLVRGLDYYTKTVFEIKSSYANGNLSLGGGGRYDGLVKLLGGANQPAVGVAFGIDRIVSAFEAIHDKEPNGKKNKVFLVQIGDAARKKAFLLIEELRKNGLSIYSSLSKDSLRNQLKIADREKVKLSLILGQEEVREDRIIIRDMESGIQEVVMQEKLVASVKKKLAMD